MRKILKAFLILVLFVVILAVAGVVFLSAAEYNPEPVEEIPIAFPLDRTLGTGHSLSVLS